MATHSLFDLHEYLTRCRHLRALLVDERNALRVRPNSVHNEEPALQNLPRLATFSPQSYAELPPQEMNPPPPVTQLQQPTTSRTSAPPPRPVGDSPTVPGQPSPAGATASIRQSTPASVVRTAIGPASGSVAHPAMSPPYGGSGAVPAAAPAPATSPLGNCRVCYENAICIVLIPCGHFALCARCANRCTDCPICRARIRGTVTSYFS